MAWQNDLNASNDLATAYRLQYNSIPGIDQYSSDPAIRARAAEFLNSPQYQQTMSGWNLGNSDMNQQNGAGWGDVVTKGIPWLAAAYLGFSGAEALGASGSTGEAAGGTAGSTVSGYTPGSYDALEGGAYGTDAASATGGTGTLGSSSYGLGEGTLYGGTAGGTGATYGSLGGTGTSGSLGAGTVYGGSGAGTLASLTSGGAPVTEAGTMAGTGAAATGSSYGSALPSTGANMATTAGGTNWGNWLQAANLVGGLYSANAAKSAANAQVDATKAGIAENARQFDTAQGNMAPYLNIGKASLGQLGYGMGLPGYDTGTGVQGALGRNFTLADFVKDPGYDFRMSEGLKGVDNSGAARGMQLSGATMKALDQYGQGFASNEYQNAYNRYNNDQSNQFNRLSGLAGTGQSATNTLANVGQNYANSNANLITSGGAARAGGIMGQANAYTNALNQGMNYYTQQQMMNRIFPQGGNQYTTDYSIPMTTQYNPNGL